MSLFVFGCTKRSPLIEETALIPMPSQIQEGDSYFSITSATGMSYDSIFKISPIFFKSFIEEGSGITLKRGNDIRFILDSTLSKEAYNLQISKVGISVSASTDGGAFYAVQTLRQLLPIALEEDNYTSLELLIKYQSIKDAPQFPYRGMHLDVGRHMYSVDFIKKYIDALSLLKMNTFHWHLTEDQGWRIEIKQYPKLQDVAAYRDETLVGHYSDQPHQFDGKRYGGYYTQDQIKDIVTYAQERFVTIIPEIEMPGHSQAAIAAYPELGCVGKQVEVAKKWGVFEEIYCTKDSTFEFLENVLDEVLELFPSEYIHIGGDEAPKTRWKNCPNCQKRIKEEGLKDEHELQSYFIRRIEGYLNAKGRQIIGWDEILEGGLAPNATVMSWRGTSGAIAAAQQHHNVVMTPTSHCYFDYYQSEKEDEPLAIGGFLSLKKVYSFNPIPEELNLEESEYILGAQGNVWTEYMPTESQVEYMAFPRMLAMSEVVWTNPKQKDYSGFTNRVERFYKRLEAMDINYANHFYDIEGDMLFKNEESFYSLTTLSEGKDIRMTTDGTEPNINSKVYQSPVAVTESGIIKAAVFNDSIQLGATFAQNINYHKAIGAKISIDKKPHKAYVGSGPEGLINGIVGSDKRFGDKEWLGFWGDDIEVTINFDEPKEISVIETRFHNGQGQWIYAPKELYFQFILDNGSIILDQRELKPADGLHVNLNYNFNTPEGMRIKVKSIAITVPNYGIIPEGNQGAGNKAWTFIDEIIVN
ncbi:beta-N-acetylhexosaminidase [Winogradskyella pelagia]|uniref:beta-N-acetylhexosaminidase n=1 Tax=Winogradskyella pelagia TaxID=2819984 RepID=UPI001FBA2027|nr:family 20 glycosylhydrolase [Winogradskyella sp. DF17]